MRCTAPSHSLQAGAAAKNARVTRKAVSSCICVTGTLVHIRNNWSRSESVSPLDVCIQEGAWRGCNVGANGDGTALARPIQIAGMRAWKGDDHQKRTKVSSEITKSYRTSRNAKRRAREMRQRGNDLHSFLKFTTLLKLLNGS